MTPNCSKIAISARHVFSISHLHVRARDFRSITSSHDMRYFGMSKSFKMASRLAVDIAIESLLENEVEEISRDGQEKYVP